MNELFTDRHNNINKSQKHYAEQKRPDTRVHTVWFHLYEVLEQEKNPNEGKQGVSAKWFEDTLTWTEVALTRACAFVRPTECAHSMGVFYKVVDF